MADKTRFHLRRAYNSLYRSTHFRGYASESPQPFNPTPEQQAYFLQAQDQKHLLDAKTQAQRLIAHVRKLEGHLKENVAFSVQRDKSIPPYVMGKQRLRVKEDTPDRASRAVREIQRVVDHLTDLQQEPYPGSEPSNQGKPELGGRDREVVAWRKEIAGMSQEAREDRLRSMLFEEEAAVERLRRGSEGLLQRVREIEAMSRKGGSVDDVVRKEDPFKAGESGRKDASTGRKDASTGKPKFEDKAKAKKAEPAEAPPKPASLSDLQKRLEQAYKSG